MITKETVPSTRLVLTMVHIQAPSERGRRNVFFHSIDLHQRAEHLGPPFLEVAIPLESALQQSLDALLRFRPRQRRLKRIEGVQKPVGGGQRARWRRPSPVIAWIVNEISVNSQ